MMRFAAEILVVVAALVMVAALISANALVGRLPEGRARARWRSAVWAILALVALDGAYLVGFWERHRTWADLILPGCLFVTGVLVRVIVGAVDAALDETTLAARPERDTITDALVGVYNRRYLEHRLAEEVARARRHAVPLAVLLFDLDHFRRLNEKWGREVGDRVLGYLGNLLLTGVRESDVVARYGGEEILVIAPATTSEQAAALADRLRAVVESENLGFGGESGSQPEVRITVSVGVAQLEPGETEWQPLVARADSAVIKAKLSGRNKVVTA
jgi:diguanylate cyclase (GGDEF)-like protein